MGQDFCSAQLMIISLIINSAAREPYSSMTPSHKEAAWPLFLLPFLAFGSKLPAGNIGIKSEGKGYHG